MKFLLNKIYLLWAFFWVVFGFVITMPINMVFMSFKSTLPLAHFMRKIWAKIIILSSFMWIKVEGKENLKGLSKWVYAPNHSSYIDIPVATLALPGVLCFMAKAELAKVPLFGYFFRTIDIAVDRKSIKSAHAAFVEAGVRLQNGQIPLLFPEGTIPADSPKLGKFKIGAFRLAIEQKVPIVPVTMIDNSARFPDKKPLSATPGQLRVVIHRPILTENLNIDDAEALLQQVYAIIENELIKYYPQISA